MNSAHLHLILSHIPVIGIPLVLLIFFISLLKKSPAIFIAGCWILLLTSITAIFVYNSGSPAHEIAETYPHFNRPAFESHRDLAPYTLLSCLFSGFLALVSLLFNQFRGQVIRFMVILTILSVLASTVLLSLSANLGGRIMHQEINAPQPANLDPGDTD